MILSWLICCPKRGMESIERLELVPLRAAWSFRIALSEIADIASAAEKASILTCCQRGARVLL